MSRLSDEGWDERQAQIREEKRKAPRSMVKEDVTSDKYKDRVKWKPEMVNKHPEALLTDSGYYVEVKREKHYD